MRISDWSSDVCSSDLGVRTAGALRGAGPRSGQGQDAVGRMAFTPDARRARCAAGRSLFGTPARAVGMSRPRGAAHARRSEEHTSELQSLMRISYAVFCLKKKKRKQQKVQLYTTNH